MSRVVLPEKTRLTLLGILLAGFLLRVWGISFGLPYQFHQDEPIVVNHALAYGTGDLNPGFFAIPPLTSYILFSLYGLMFLVGKVMGAWQGTQDFAVSFFRDPTIFYLVGRFFIGVLPGTASIFLTYKLAERSLTKNAALFAAAVMSFSFLNVVNSHYIYTDMLLTALILLAYERLFFLFKAPNFKNYCLSGLFIGLCIGVKYNGVVMLAPYLLAHFMSSRKSLGEIFFSAKLWLGFLLIAAAFIMVNPFAVIDLDGFMRSSLSQSGAFCYTGWTHHLTYSLFQGISVPIALMGGLGIFFFAFSNNGWHKIVAVFPVALYAVLVFKSQHFSRYVIFLVPFLAIGSGYLLFDRLGFLGSGLKARRAAIMMAFLFLVPTTVKSVKADILFSSPDTRVIAAQWIKDNVKQGSRIACDSTSFRPALSQPYSQLVEKRLKKRGDKENSSVSDIKLELMISVSDPAETGYPLYFLYEDPSRQGQFLSTLPAMPYEVYELSAAGIEYVTVNNQVTSPEKEIFVKKLDPEWEIYKEISPYRDGVFRPTLDLIASTYMAVKDEDVFTRVSPGPAIRIYQRALKK